MGIEESFVDPSIPSELASPPPPPPSTSSAVDRGIMSTITEPRSAAFSLLDVVAAILALTGLLPMAGCRR